MAITTLNNRSINRSDTAAAGQKWTATSATASDFQAAGGGLVLLSTTNVANTSSTTINPPFSSTYTSYKIIISGISPEDTNQDLLFTFLDSGGTEKTSDYRYTVGGWRGSSESSEGSESGSYCKWSRNAHNDTGTVNAEILITQPQQTMRTSIIGMTNLRFTSDATSYAELFGCWMDSTDAFTQIKFYPASGDWNGSGKIMVYGFKES